MLMILCHLHINLISALSHADPNCAAQTPTQHEQSYTDIKGMLALPCKSDDVCNTGQCLHPALDIHMTQADTDL